jgi:protoporphyrinogen oxidase
MPGNQEPSTIVIGAGPAGLTAALLLVNRPGRVTVLEQDTRLGGLACTADYKGFRFDMGGHRFFTKAAPIAELWRSMLGPELLRRPRLSRIYYDGKFFDYPLRPLNALAGLGLWRAFLVLVSYGWSQVRPIKPERSFEDWVSNRFGRRLFRIFFKAYTEKVWGIPCNTIGAQWAAQRIKGLSLFSVVCNMLAAPFGGGRNRIKTLIEEFEYPRLGPGMMWEAFGRAIEQRGGFIFTDARVRRLRTEGDSIVEVEAETAAGPVCLRADQVISTMPLRELVAALSPPPPAAVIEATGCLKDRDFLTVALVIDQPHTFPDNWIYIHDPQVRLGRVQNYKNWSPDMVGDPGKTCLGLEYFCSEGDEVWNMPDEELVRLGTREVGLIGLVDPARVIDGTVVRKRKAYPIYDEGYEAAVAVVREHVKSIRNLQVAGRNGMHKYNNQDHSMVTALLAVRNLAGEKHDIWAVNADDDYQEEGELDLEALSDDFRRIGSGSVGSFR